PHQIRRYIGKISQPILDRIDMMIEVFPVEYEKLRKRERTESSEELRQWVAGARKRQAERSGKQKFHLNAELTRREVEEVCVFDEEAEETLHQLFRNNEFSTRRYYRILKLARTIADLENCEKIKKTHLVEAYSYCNVGKKYWRVEE
ncbi:MAG: ATP-binding protein, partial [Lachnospiraceae bacterium]|nr:ATP-binding protein [Lachnospiraceae bacterium]